jgi:hypothetical protein
MVDPQPIHHKSHMYYKSLVKHCRANPYPLIGSLFEVKEQYLTQIQTGAEKSRQLYNGLSLK